MIPIPRAPQTVNYRRSVMSAYLNGATLAPLREVMMLPKAVAEAKVILMIFIQTHQHVMDSNPAVVVENIRNVAITHYQSTGNHLNLCQDVPQGMQVFSAESSSRSSRFHSEDEGATEEDLDKSLKEAQDLLREQQDKLAKQRELRMLRQQLEATRRQLQKATDELEYQSRFELPPKDDEPPKVDEPPQ
jgi:hypothetical protein